MGGPISELNALRTVSRGSSVANRSLPAISTYRIALSLVKIYATITVPIIITDTRPSSNLTMTICATRYTVQV